MEDREIIALYHARNEEAINQTAAKSPPVIVGPLRDKGKLQIPPHESHAFCGAFVILTIDST